MLSAITTAPVQVTPPQPPQPVNVNEKKSTPSSTLPPASQARAQTQATIVTTDDELDDEYDMEGFNFDDMPVLSMSSFATDKNDASYKISQGLLKGWALLDQVCPSAVCNGSVPLMRDREGNYNSSDINSGSEDSEEDEVDLYIKNWRQKITARETASMGGLQRRAATDDASDDSTGRTEIYYNLNLTQLHNHEVHNNEGYVINNGTFAVDTGKFTGRSPNDKWIVQQSPSADNLWWGPVNQPISPYVYDELFNLAVDHYNTVDKVYIFDGFVGASPKSRKRVRFISELAWQAHFVNNMFLRPDFANNEALR
eukprot:gene34822-42945_t